MRGVYERMQYLCWDPSMYALYLNMLFNPLFLKYGIWILRGKEWKLKVVFHLIQKEKVFHRKTVINNNKQKCIERYFTKYLFLQWNYVYSQYVTVNINIIRFQSKTNLVMKIFVTLNMGCQEIFHLTLFADIFLSRFFWSSYRRISNRLNILAFKLNVYLTIF